MNIFVILISALLIIIVLLRRRVPIGPAILTAGIFIWAAAAPQPHYLWNAWIETFSAYRTYDLIFALYFVMCLEIELRTGGILDDLVRSLHRLLKSPRLTLAIMPAFLGLLPSLGGARFSAPIVEITAKGLNLTAEHKANINFWFRHIFEFSSPIIPGMLMACSIAAIPFSSLLLHLAWVTPLFFLVGWLILMRPLKLPPHIITETGKVNLAKELKTLCFAVAPVAANFILITAAGTGHCCRRIIYYRHTYGYVAGACCHSNANYRRYGTGRFNACGHCHGVWRCRADAYADTYVPACNARLF